MLSHLRSAARLVVKKDTFATRIPPENKKIFAQKYWPEVRYIKGRRCQRWHYKYNIKHQPSVAPRGQPKSNHTYIEEAKALSDKSITTLAKRLDISKEMFFLLFQSLFWDLMLCCKYRGHWHTGRRQKCTVDMLWTLCAQFKKGKKSVWTHNSGALKGSALAFF